MEDLLRTWIRFSVPCRVVSASQETKRSCRLNETTAGRRRTVVWVNSWFSCSQTSRLWIITTSLNVKTYCTVWLFKGKKKSVTEELISWIRNGFTLVTTGCIWGGVHSLDLLYVKVSGKSTLQRHVLIIVGRTRSGLSKLVLRIKESTLRLHVSAQRGNQLQDEVWKHREGTCWFCLSRREKRLISTWTLNPRLQSFSKSLKPATEKFDFSVRW